MPKRRRPPPDDEGLVRKPNFEMQEDVPEAAENAQDAAPLPSPPSPFCRENADFFTYWGSLTPGQIKRTIVYTYRKYPVCDRYHCLNEDCGKPISRPPSPNARSRCSYCGWEGKITTNIRKLVDPITPEQILEIFGWGDYVFILIDTASKGGKPVTQTFVRTERDPNFPPVIEDMRDIVVSDPANRSYIEGLHARGIRLPG